MKPIEFDGCNMIMAKDQPEYNPMPGLAFGDDQGTVLYCWKLTWRERFKLLLTGKLWQYMITFGRPQTPQLLTANRLDDEQDQQQG
jgi:hypothetical protein